MNRPLSDYRLGRIILWPLYPLTQLGWFLFCVFGTIAAFAYAYIRSSLIYFRGGKSMTEITAYEGWAMLELMGHRQRVGYVREIEAFGNKLLRIDIPNEGGDITEFYGCAAIYSLRPMSEDVARDAMKRHGDIRPVRPAEYRTLSIPARADGMENAMGYDDHEYEPLP